MDIWQITVGEPSPIEKDSVRLLRTGILSKELTKRGHNVTWWSSSFDHFGKKFLSQSDLCHKWDGGELSLIHTDSFYKTNVSLQRIQHNKEVAKKFSSLAKERKTPDLILCSFPTIELAYEAIIYGKINDVPVVVDVRDLWPDVYLTAAPKILQPLAKKILSPYYKKARYILKNCTSMTAVSQGYLDWGMSLGKRSQAQIDQVFPIGYVKPNQEADTPPESKHYLSELGISEDKIMVWFVGSFGRSYDLDTVIDTAKSLQQKNELSFQFVISGDGDAKERLLYKASGLKNTVFTGWIGSDKIKILQKRADVGLMAYATGAKQGMPNKLFEYMAAGIPILSSLEGEGADTIGSHGIGMNYHPGSSMSLEEKLMKLKDFETRRQLKKTCLEVFNENYSAESIYSKFANYLEQLKSNH